MTNPNFEQRLLDLARALPSEEQEKLLDVAVELLGYFRRSMSGQEFIERTKDIKISKEDLELMEQAIEEIDMYDYWEAKSRPVKPELFNVVALRRDLDEHELRRGQVGTIVEQLGEGVFEVEFSDNNGHTYATLGVKAENLLVLHYEPIAERQ